MPAAQAPPPPLIAPAAPPARALFAAFFVSGAAALLLEVAWTRLLLLRFGATPLAVAAVLAAFMGGMAVGSAAAPRLLRRDPLLVYALLEGGAGLYALATPWLLSLAGGGPALGLAAALLALLPATAAMGASLPVLAQALERSDAPAGSLVGRLYAVNTAGAVAGPLLGVFLLFPALGLSRALHAAALMDVAVSVGVLALWTGGSWRPEPAPAPAFGPPPAALLLAVFASGGAAMVYEIAWSRTLSLVFGSSVYGVSIMLSTFLLGLAGGSAAVARLLRRRRDPLPPSACAWLLAGAALAAFLSLVVAGGLPVVFVEMWRWSPGHAPTLFAAQIATAAGLMAPGTLCLGAMLPVAVAALPGAAGVGRRVAWLYTANLVGATVGTLLAAGVLLGSLGIEGSVRAASLLALLVALGFFLLPSLRPAGTIAGLAGMVLVAGMDPAWGGLARSFGLYGDLEAATDVARLPHLLASYHLLYYRDGATATVSVQEVGEYRLLKINGKTDASNGPEDTRTQLLLGHLPLLAAPARRVAVIGWGSGETVGAALTHDITSLDAFEIEPAVVEASRWFEPANGTPLRDRRVRLLLGDARARLGEAGPYDVIVSEPSNPWLTGVANLFTADFFRLLASRLEPAGVVCQWFHLYGMSERSTRSLVATFRSVFPHTLVFGERDLLLLGSRRRLRLDLPRMRALFDVPGIGASLARAQVRYPFDLLVDLRLDEEGAKAFAAGAALNTDDNMRLELEAPRTLYQDTTAAVLASLDQHPPSLEASLVGYRSGAELDLERAASLFTRGRNQEALASCRRALEAGAGFEGHKLLGQILQQLGRPEEARAALEQALALGGEPAARSFVESLLRSLPARPAGGRRGP